MTFWLYCYVIKRRSGSAICSYFRAHISSVQYTSEFLHAAFPSASSSASCFAANLRNICSIVGSPIMKSSMHSNRSSQHNAKSFPMSRLPRSTPNTTRKRLCENACCSSTKNLRPSSAPFSPPNTSCAIAVRSLPTLASSPNPTSPRTEEQYISSWQTLPCTSLTLLVLPRHCNSPPTMIPTRSHTASTSLMLCDAVMIV
mmetsp:Transcript_15709/g.38915  ORF Transcript_15709/g.38915 Transcript_15709/m.38915 type:complete len:200 (-) Transcript_15709:1867-2466(-)